MSSRSGSSSSAPNANATPLGSSSSKPGRFPGSSSSAPGSGPHKRGGFQTLPSHIASQRKNAFKGKGGKLVLAPGGGKGQYLGHAQKLKESLIAKAKLKKSYSKILKKEGLSSERLSGRPAPPHMEEASEKKKGKRRADAGGENDSDDDTDMDMEDAMTDDEEMGRDPNAHRRPQVKAPKKERPSDTGGASSWSQRTRDVPVVEIPSAPQRDPNQPSLRDMKRQAYFGLPKSTIRTPSASAESTTTQQPGKGKSDPSEKMVTHTFKGGIRKPYESQSRSDGASRGGRGARGGRFDSNNKQGGRPRLAARIGVMLEEIKRSKGVA